jgi:protoheme IX farnesyltransferase
MKAVVMTRVEVAPLERPTTPPALPEVWPAAAAEAPGRLADYLELTKPKIAVMALFTVAVGYVLGAAPHADPVVLFHTLLGAGLVAAGGSALNQWWERRIDGRMFRTMKRPLPAGRISPAEALVFGVGLSVLGLAYLLSTVPTPAAVVAAVTLVSYAGLYTLLKTATVWNTVVGAVPGALPPVIGWAAARGWDGAAGAAGLFLILFFWQLPHFLAIAWMYREDYARGGLRMLPGIDPTGRLTAVTMIVTAALLLPAALVPVAAGLAGWGYTIGSVAFGVFFVAKCFSFAKLRTDRSARTVLRASLLYLPGVLGLLLADRFLTPLLFG